MIRFSVEDGKLYIHLPAMSITVKQQKLYTSLFTVKVVLIDQKNVRIRVYRYDNAMTLCVLRRQGWIHNP